MQPVSGLGLVILAVFSHFYLKVSLLAYKCWCVSKFPCVHMIQMISLQERLHKAEWGAVVVSTAGTIGLGATAGSGPEPEEAKPLSKLRIAVVLLMFTTIIVVGVLNRLHGHTRQARRVTRTSATTCGLQVSISNASRHHLIFHLAWQTLPYISLTQW